MSQQGNIEKIYIQYRSEEKQIILEIYLENAPYYREPMDQANVPKQRIGNREWYITECDKYQTVIGFDDNCVYAVTADSLDIIQTLLKGNENEKTD